MYKYYVCIVYMCKVYICTRYDVLGTRYLVHSSSVHVCVRAYIYIYIHSTCTMYDVRRKMCIYIRALLA